MITPTDKIRQLNPETNHPASDAEHNDGRFIVDFVVCVRKADENPSVNGNIDNVQEHANASSKTKAGHADT
ncbi:hypothetical protein DPMN_042649 [Dreissena polymorpha]|uniref:Uncharacterized protein n=1 Tax=Dreissena polymorpha TaxID=45954 RepID=A0A9D4HX35_DREPO|nr:hypothetical protein DPMN_042649 [Dreissena polymorpha]